MTGHHLGDEGVSLHGYNDKIWYGDALITPTNDNDHQTISHLTRCPLCEPSQTVIPPMIIKSAEECVTTDHR